MDGMSDDQLDDLVEEQLRYLRGKGPRPDLSSFDDDTASEVMRLLEIVDALADSVPASPKFEEDPVAVRLGLVTAPPVGLSGIDDGVEDDPVLQSLRELTTDMGETAIKIDILDEPLADAAGRSASMICRSLVEAVAVVVFDGESVPPAQHAVEWFQRQPEFSAIAFSHRDATRAAVVTPPEAVQFLVPASGWCDPVDLSWEPLRLALGRYFERSMPRWDHVAALPAVEVTDDLASEVELVAGETLRRVAVTRPRLPHKQQARDFVAECDVAVISGWVDRVRRGDLLGEQLATEIADTCGVGL